MHMASMIFCKRISCTPANIILTATDTAMLFTFERHCYASLEKTEISDCLFIVTHYFV